MTPPPPPAPRADQAFFLDVDGTLIDIAAHPDEVHVPPVVVAELRRLLDTTRGALALVSGRSIAQVDALFSPLTLPMAGLHGLQRRDAAGVVSMPAPSLGLAPVRSALAAFAAATPGVVLEDKGLALALHYRGAPHAAGAARDAVRDALAASGRGELQALEGKMVLEVKPGGVDKGQAIAAFLAEPPWQGREPAFAGDDVTDEDGFAVVNQRGGQSIYVGTPTSATQARFALPDAAALLDWLRRVA